MDVPIFLGSFILGTFIGLTCRKNNVQIIPEFLQIYRLGDARRRYEEKIVQ